MPDALRDARKVRAAIRRDACLLCRRPQVNEAALCAVCFSFLEGDEYRLANRWLTGEGPP